MELRFYPDAVLRKRCKEYSESELEEAVSTAKGMLEIMYRRRGIGLAGPQVGVLRRIFVLDVSEERDSPVVCINPRIPAIDGEPVEAEVGCLSFPGIYAPVVRSPSAAVEYVGADGEGRSIKGEGLLARAIQHETDHLDGILFIDRLTPAARMRLRGALKDLEQAFESG